MSILLAAILLAAQQSNPPAQPAVPAVQKQKPKQVCEYIEVTGSRARQRVCRDAEGNLDLGPGVSSSVIGKAKTPKAPAPSMPSG